MLYLTRIFPVPGFSAVGIYSAGQLKIKVSHQCDETS